MIITLPATTLTAALLGLVFLWLTVIVLRRRVATATQIGDGGSGPLQLAVRAHANFTEYVPLALILQALVEFQLGTTTFVWIMGGVLVLARIAHGAALMHTSGPSSGRAFGLLATLAVIALLIVPLLYQSVARYL